MLSASCFLLLLDHPEYGECLDCIIYHLVRMVFLQLSCSCFENAIRSSFFLLFTTSQRHPDYLTNFFLQSLDDNENIHQRLQSLPSSSYPTHIQFTILPKTQTRSSPEPQNHLASPHLPSTPIPRLPIHQPKPLKNLPLRLLHTSTPSSNPLQINILPRLPIPNTTAIKLPPFEPLRIPS